jgi:mono/diheme cytochrome c family protein
MKLGTTIVPVSMLAAVLAFGATHVRAEDAPGGGGMDVSALWKKNCASCHGDDGKGQTKAGKSKKVQDLTNPEVRAKFDRDRMIKSTKEGMKSEDGKELMKPYGEKLSDAEIAALTDYVINTLK